MDKVIQFKQVEEVRQQARFARLAFGELRSVASSVDGEKVFFFVHAFLYFAANVSRWLWPSREASKERGEMLRRELKVEQDSPLRLASIRPQLEGEDERHEDWLERLDNPNYVDINVMPAAALGTFQQDAFQRNLDPDIFRLELRGVSCELRPVADALRQLETAIDFWKRDHHPW